MDRAGMHYNVIPSTVAAESMLLKSRDMTVYGFHSSLLYYAALWGHRAVSLLKVLERLDPGFLRRHARLNLPETFFRRVSVPEDLSPGQ